jgi:DNA adenine methylase
MASTKAKDTVKPVAAKPFLKWAGGKSQLIQQFERFFPGELKDGKIRRYFEPFVGGGAVFFYLMSKYGQNIEFKYISDINEELILVYRVVQSDVEKLITRLKRLQSSYLKRDEEGRKDYFHQVRDDFNKNHNGFDFDNPSPAWIERAAQIIFMNKTCFNGLFRVNRSGHFNVPFGRYKRPKILDEENLRKASELLKGAIIKRADFAGFKRRVTPRSFVYFDPPYRPISATANFTSYSSFTFDETQQKRLASLFKQLHVKSALVMLSNSDPKNHNPNDDFFETEYSAFTIERVDAYRMINCNASKRGQIKELVIRNYSISSDGSLRL